ncbi:MAG: ABC transporter permease subunit [Devosia sp.]
MIRLAALWLAGLLATLLVAAVVIFATLAFVPGQPADGPDFPAWLGGMLIGQAGQSDAAGGSIGSALAGRLAVTLPLVLFAALIALALGAVGGYLAARQNGRWPDRAARVATGFGEAAAPFWLGMMLVLIFSIGLHWLPIGGFVPWMSSIGRAVASLILPALALGLPAAAMMAAATRAELVAALQSDYARSARARGLTEAEVLRQHGLHNALPALLRSAGVLMVGLIAGSIVVEAVFYLPGLGRLMLDAVDARDVPLLRGTIMLIVLLVAIALFAGRIAAALIDPKDRASRHPSRPAERSRLDARIALPVATLVVGLALLSLLWTPYPIDRLEIGETLEGPSLTHLLGTDLLGRDTLSLVMKALLTGLSAAAVGAMIAGLVGLPLGLVAASMGGFVGRAVLSVSDFLIVLPAVSVTAALSAIVGAGTVPVAIAIGIAGVPLATRAVTTAVLRVTGHDYITASRLSGLSTGEAWRSHVLSPVLKATLLAMVAILPAGLLAEAALSYLGLGAQPPVSSLGSMLRDAQAQMPLNALPAIIPGLVLVAAVASLAPAAAALSRIRLPRPPMLKGVGDGSA